MCELHPALSAEFLDSVSRLLANVAADWTDEREKKTGAPDAEAKSADDAPLPVVILQMEQAFLDHFPEMPTYAARSLSGDVFEEVQQFHEWKVHPFPNHLLPPSMRRGPAPPWPGDPAPSQPWGLRLVRIDRVTASPTESTFDESGSEVMNDPDSLTATLVRCHACSTDIAIVIG